MDFVQASLDHAIAKITLRSPGGNRINFQMRSEILQSIERVAESKARVLLVTGDGNDFCLGGDIREWSGVPGAELRPKIGVLAQAIAALEDLSIPTVAVVRGGCVGGGLELALGCDLILAAESARFIFPEATLGIMTLQGGVYQLAERIGRNKAFELTMLSVPIDAVQMKEWNIVNTVVAENMLAMAATDLAQRLAAGPAEVYARTKSLLKIWRNEGRHAACQALYDLSMPLFDSPSVQHALGRAAAAMKTSRVVPSMDSE